MLQGYPLAAESIIIWALQHKINRHTAAPDNINARFQYTAATFGRCKPG